MSDSHNLDNYKTSHEVWLAICELQSLYNRSSLQECKLQKLHKLYELLLDFERKEKKLSF